MYLINLYNNNIIKLMYNNIPIQFKYNIKIALRFYIILWKDMRYKSFYYILYGAST